MKITKFESSEINYAKGKVNVPKCFHKRCNEDNVKDYKCIMYNNSYG